MGKRRGNGEGSISRRKDGRWYARVSLPNGQRHGKYFPSQRECREWLKETLAQVDDGLTAEGANEMLSTFLERWLVIIADSLRPSTVRAYTNSVRKYIMPGIGRRRMKDLRPDHIQQLYAKCKRAGAKEGTLKAIHVALHCALNSALRCGALKRNPADVVNKPRVHHREMKTLTLDQVQVLLDATREHELGTLLHLAISTGLRQGELLGLRWSDLDWKTGVLQVQRQLQRVAGQGLQFMEPKTSAGRRSVVLGRELLARLGEHRKRQMEYRLIAGARWQESGLIFPSTIGTPMDARDLLRNFKAVLAAAGLPEVRFHDLRHTAATLMLQQGVPFKVVQESLGHARSSLTLDVYSHVVPAMQQDAADRMEAALGSGHFELA
jgi:integrase